MIFNFCNYINNLAYFFYKEIQLLINKYIYLFKYLNNEIYFSRILQNNFEINYNIFKNKNFIRFYKFNSKIHQIQKKDTKELIIIESLINHPLYCISNTIIGYELNKQFNANIIGLIRTGDFTSREIMRSYGVKNFILIDKSNFFLRLFYFYKSYLILKKIKTIKNLLNYKINKIEIGKAVYEHYVRMTGYPGPKNINYKFTYFLSEAFKYEHNFDKEFKYKKIKYWVQSENQFIPHRILFQKTLSNTPILSKSGIKDIGIRIFKKFTDKNSNRSKISKKLINYLEKNHRSEILENVNNSLIKKLKNNIGKEDHQEICRLKKKKFYSRKDLYKFFNFDNKKPIILVLSHELTDGNFGNNWNLFKDDREWLEKTISIAKVNKNINWLIKSHPSEKFYNSKLNTYSIFSKNVSSIKNNNIKFFPDDYDVKTIVKYLKCVITSHGSAGYQYPMLGVSTITCGDTLYYDGDFNIKPKNKKEYFNLLTNIKKIKKIDKIKINKAKIFNYTFNKITKINVPTIYFSDITMKYDKKKFWENSYKLLKKNHKKNKRFSNMIKLQINNNNENLINFNRINFKKNNF